MTEASTSPPPLPAVSATPRSGFWPRLRGFLLISPLTTLGIYTILSLVLQENYPFSHYPMYSDPSAERPYYLITDGEGKPLPIQTLTGVTCPKIGKIYRTKSNKLAKDLNIKGSALTQAHTQQVSEEMFAYLRQEATQKGQVMPEKLRLVKSYLTYENGQVVETPTIMGQE